MKILIADDEELVRVGLRDVLRGIAQGDDIYEAVNGRTMIEKVGEIRPDICFVDIKMPGVSGLEAIAELSSDFPETGWIILSGYSDFEYARKALSLGVVDYLLKPVTEAEVETALIKASSKRIEAGRLKREKFEYRAGGVLNNSSAVEFDDFLKQIERYAALVYIPLNNDMVESVDEHRNLIMKLRCLLDQKPPDDYAGVFYIMDGFPSVIAGGIHPDRFLKELGGDVPEVDENTYMLFFTPVFDSIAELFEYFDSAVELKGHADVSPDSDSSDCSSRIVRQAEKLVHELYTRPIGVAQIADELNVTPNYLSTLFKRYKNVSFTKYITELRLNEAPKLLENPGITVKEVAFNLGYMSSRHFTKLFREKYGMPPTEYRK